MVDGITTMPSIPCFIRALKFRGVFLNPVVVKILTFIINIFKVTKYLGSIYGLTD